MARSPRSSCSPGSGSIRARLVTLTRIVRAGPCCERSRRHRGKARSLRHRIAMSSPTCAGLPRSWSAAVSSVGDTRPHTEAASGVASRFMEGSRLDRGQIAGDSCTRITNRVLLSLKSAAREASPPAEHVEAPLGLCTFPRRGAAWVTSFTDPAPQRAGRVTPAEGALIGLGWASCSFLRPRAA